MIICEGTSNNGTKLRKDHLIYYFHLLRGVSAVSFDMFKHFCVPAGHLRYSQTTQKLDHLDSKYLRSPKKKRGLRSEARSLLELFDKHLIHSLRLGAGIIGEVLCIIKCSSKAVAALYRNTSHRQERGCGTERSRVAHPCERSLNRRTYR